MKIKRYRIKKKRHLTAFLALIAIVVLMVAFLFFMQVGLFEVLGIHYESTSTFLLFLVASFVVDMVLVLLVRKLKPHRFAGWSGTIFMEWFAIHCIDDWMGEIVIATWSEVALVVSFFVINKAFEPSEKEES
jgi:predicted anti-sigma-YlaC factor YlaD